MLFKPLAIFATVLGVVAGEHPTSEPTSEPTSFGFGECPSPLSLRCDTDPFNIIPEKTTVKLEDPGVTVVASVACEKDYSRAQACVIPYPGGGLGIVVTNSYGGPMCFSEVRAATALYFALALLLLFNMHFYVYLAPS